MPNMSTIIVDNTSKTGIVAQVRSSARKRYTATISKITADGANNPIYGQISPLKNIKDNITPFIDRFAFEAKQNLGENAKTMLLELRSKAPKTYEAMVAVIDGEKELPVFGQKVKKNNFPESSQLLLDKFADAPAALAGIKDFLKAIS